MIAIVDYRMGNVGSILNMLRRIGAPAEITPDPARIRAADKLILPGVGAFDAGMENIHKSGLHAVLNERVLGGAPLLGICLGAQLLSRSSEEGKRPGLGWLDARTVRFRAGDGLKVPHMGWNTLRVRRPCGLLDGLEQDSRFYFVHSYHLECREEDVVATTHYGYDVTAVVARANVFGVQFHPEKSHRFGMRLLRNFAEMTC